MGTVSELLKIAVQQHGSQAKLAAACGVTQASIWQAIDTGRCSAELAMAVEQAMDGRQMPDFPVTAALIRPDLPWPHRPTENSEQVPS